MDDDGNILIKRIAKSNVYIKGWQAEGNGAEQSTSVSNEIIRNNGLLEFNKAVRLFDMKKFQQNMSRELRRSYPDRRKLENQCICCISFVKDANDMLDLPVWVMVINIVAMDMLKSKMPPSKCIHITFSCLHVSTVTNQLCLCVSCSSWCSDIEASIGTELGEHV